MPKPKKIEPLGRARRVNEFVADLVQIGQGKPGSEFLAELAPFATDLFDAVKEASAFAKFLVRLNELRNPGEFAVRAEALAHAAFNDALVKALRASKPIAGTMLSTSARSELQKYDWPESFFEGFSLPTARTHPFLSKANQIAFNALLILGINETEARNILRDVSDRFEVSLRYLLDHPSAASRFGMHLSALKNGTPESMAADKMRRHREHQIRLFENAAISADEPFSLSDVLVEPLVDISTWGNLKANLLTKETRIPLTRAVLSWIAEGSHLHPVLIHSVAGAGKSTATLALFKTLADQGLNPIRVLLRDLNLDGDLFANIEQAISFREKEDRTHMLRGGAIFDVATPFHGFEGQQQETKGQLRDASIVPYVLILDGWDELTIGASGDLISSVDRLLGSIQKQLCRRLPSVPVIITGRPTPGLRNSPFLHDASLAFALRPFDTDRLHTFAQKIREAAKRSGAAWNLPSEEVLRPVFEEFEREQRRVSIVRSSEDLGNDPYRVREEGEEVRASLYEVLSLPLLAHLALRVLAETKGDPIDLFRSPTRLYQALIDVTCPGAGRRDQELVGYQDRAYLTGETLRRLLQKTATALGAGGNDHLTRDELRDRLTALDAQLWKGLENANPDQALASLVVSYYFRDGNLKLGVEFLHKSFREYLFAEDLLTTLEDGAAKLLRPIRTSFPVREDHSDKYRVQLQSLAEELGRRLSNTWLSPEVWTFLRELIHMRVEQAAIQEKDGDPKLWNLLRDLQAALQLLWGEWITGSYRDDSHPRDLLPALPSVLDWLGTEFTSRLVFRDAHFGDGLYGITVELSHALASAHESPPSRDVKPGVRARQRWEFVQFGSAEPRNPSKEDRFAPAHEEVWSNICARIDSSPGRAGQFPAGHRNRGVDLRMQEISMPVEANPPNLFLDYANLSHCQLSGGILSGQRNIQEVFADNIQVHSSYINECSFGESSLKNAQFSRCQLHAVHFRYCDLSGAQFRFARLHSCSFEGSNLTGVSFEKTELISCIFTDAVLSEVTPPERIVACYDAPAEWPASPG